MAPALNLERLTVSDAEYVPPRRGRTAEPNPFDEVILDSYNNEQGKSVRVPLAGEQNDRGVDVNVVKVMNLIRAAAKAAGVGVSVQWEPHSKTQADVLFLAKDRRKYDRAEENGTATE